jgi:hypothetical protein
VFESHCGNLLDYFGIFGLCACGVPVTRLSQNLAEFWKGKSYPRLLASKTGAEALLALTVASIKVQESRSGVKTDPEGELVAVRRKGYDTARSQSN